MLDGDIYKNDDIRYFENLQWEMMELLEYLKGCNLRKVTYFKLALGILSVFISGFGIIINAESKGAKLLYAYEFKFSISLILIFMGLLSYVIIKEFYSIHATRVTTLRQINCLRQASDSIRFKKHGGNYPNNISELRDENTEYWKAFGRHRKLPIENASLKKHERSFSQSPDMFMVLVLLVISLLLQICGALYLFFSSTFHQASGVLCGVSIALGSVYFINDFKHPRRKLKQALGVPS